MKTEQYRNNVLSDRETLLLLEAFCHEALRFLKMPSDQFPTFKTGASMEADGKVNPLYIDYSNSKVLVFIPVFRIMCDTPTCYRLIGYQIARFWKKFIATGVPEVFDASDMDSLVFASALMVVKGIKIKFNPVVTEKQVLNMLRNEFQMDCELVSALNITNKTRQNIYRFTPSAQSKHISNLKELYDRNVNRPLDSIGEGQKGSKTNPFANVDEAAAYILQIEKERLLSDSYREFVSSEQYYYDGNSFRISWASANVSYYPIESLTDNIFVVNQLSTHNKFVLKPSLAHNKFLYRGQSEFFSPCRPSLFRKKKDYYVEDIIQINELECLLRSHPLVRLFEQGFELFHDNFRFKIQYEGLAQHYYNNTSYLDLTSNMDIAKFFAVTKFNMTKDCYEKYQGTGLGVLYYFDLKADSFQLRKNRSYYVENIGKQPFMRSGNQFGFLVNMNKNDDFNTYPDVRYVFFRHDSDITDRIFTQYENGDKIMPTEILRTHWHSRMNDDTEKKLISRDALKLNYAINPNDSHTKILKALQKKGFKVRSYKPSFTKDELDLYYDNALEFWEEFCSNIYFYGPEGALMKEHLRNLPKDSRYKWAFYK